MARRGAQSRYFNTSLDMRKLNRGLTLIRTLVTLVLVAIIAGIAVPSFARAIANARIRTGAECTFSCDTSCTQGIHHATQRCFHLPEQQRRACQPGLDWSEGWMMFSNLDRDEPPRIDLEKRCCRSISPAPRSACRQIGVDSRSGPQRSALRTVLSLFATGTTGVTPSAWWSATRAAPRRPGDSQR